MDSLLLIVLLVLALLGIDTIIRIIRWMRDIWEMHQLRTSLLREAKEREAQESELAQEVVRTLRLRSHQVGVALVDIEGLIRVMVDRIPEHMEGQERDGYVTAICDILIHINDAQVEYSPEVGFEKARVPVRPRRGVVSDVLGVKEYRTGAWAQ